MTKIKLYRPINHQYKVETFRQGRMWGARIRERTTGKVIVSTEQIRGDGMAFPTRQMAANAVILFVELGKADDDYYIRQELKISRG